MQGNGWESGQSGGNSSDDDETGEYMTLKAFVIISPTDKVIDSDYQWCCDEWHKKGRDLKQVSSQSFTYPGSC